MFHFLTIGYFPMQLQSVNLEGLVAIIMVFSIVLIPVIGLTARFALKPTVEALGQFFRQKGSDEALQLMERRMALMEQQLESMEGTVRRLDEAHQFDRQLKAGAREANPEG